MRNREQTESMNLENGLLDFIFVMIVIHRYASNLLLVWQTSDLAILRANRK